MKLIEIDLPQYSIQQEPDVDAIGKIIDDEVKNHFLNKSIILRGIAYSEHSGISIDDLIDIIIKTGTDKYDPQREGDRYDNIENKHIDLFGVPATVTKDSEMSKVIFWGFYHSAKEIHGYPVKIDIIIIYDATQLDQIHHQYEGRDDIKDDGFTFINPDNKSDAVLGIIKIM